MYGLSLFGTIIVSGSITFTFFPHSDTAAGWALIAMAAVPVLSAVLLPLRPVLRIDSAGIWYKENTMLWENITGVYEILQNFGATDTQSDNTRCMVTTSDGKDIVVRLWNTRATSRSVISFCKNLKPEITYGESRKEVLSPEVFLRKGLLVQIISRIIFAAILAGCMYLMLSGVLDR